MKKLLVKPLSFNEGQIRFQNATPSNMGLKSGRTTQMRNEPSRTVHTERSAKQHKDLSDRQSASAQEQSEEIQVLRERIKQLERTIIIQQKEISRLKEMNGFLLQSNQAKLELINQERKTMYQNQIAMAQSQVMSKLPMVERQKTQMMTLFNESQTKQRTSLVIKKEGSLVRNASPKKTILKATSINSDDDMGFRSETRLQREANNFLNFLQVEECFKISAILNINLKDSEAVNLYESDGTLMLLEKLLEVEDNFQDLISHASPQKISFLYDKLSRLLSEHKQLFALVLRLKKILQGAIQMSQSVLLDDALNTIVDEIVACLECDRASCFVVDQNKNEIWSKVAKGTSQVIRSPIGKGVAGYVAEKKELLNIQNAYLDQRFNREIDQRTNYKTKTLLVCPILDHDKCLGVLQCVNKLEGHFSKDDEALLLILAEFSRVVLNNAINHDEQLLIHNKLRHTIKTGLILGEKVADIQQLMSTSQSRLKAMMNVEHGKIALISQNKKQVIHCSEEGHISTHQKDLGIMAEVLETGKQINIFNCYAHAQFNPLVDLETHMPVIMMPIRSPLNYQEIIGAIEVVNLKGFATMFQKVQPKITTIDQEVLEFFTKQVAQSVIINQYITRGRSPKRNAARYTTLVLTHSESEIPPRSDETDL